MNIGVIVVTYNRAAMLAECLTRITAQTRPPAFVLVVDNASTDDTRAVLARFPGVETLHLPTNTGGAGGFSAGMRAALERDFDRLCILDDDAFMVPDSLEALERLSAGVRDDAVICARLVPNAEEGAGGHGLRRLEYGMFVGFCLSRALLERVGLPHGDYFIYWDDVEYSHRIRRAGGQLLEFGDFRLVHQDYSQRGEQKVRLLGREVSYTRMPGWRTYYYVRNRIAFVRSAGEPGLGLRAALGLSKLALLSLLLQRENLAPVLRGVVDGLAGRMGKRVSP